MFNVLGQCGLGGTPRRWPADREAPCAGEQGDLARAAVGALPQRRPPWSRLCPTPSQDGLTSLPQVEIRGRKIRGSPADRRAQPETLPVLLKRIRSEKKKLPTMQSQTHGNEKGAVLCRLQVSPALKERHREKPQPGGRQEPG